MRVGDPLEAWYPLRGPLPAGTWRITASSFVEGVKFHFDLLYRDGQGDHAIGATDVVSGLAPVVGTIAGGAAAAKCGDLLVLRARNDGPQDAELGLSIRFP